jgi:hypothetical protein
MFHTADHQKLEFGDRIPQEKFGIILIMIRNQVEGAGKIVKHNLSAQEPMGEFLIKI